jgi:DNA modification methylase
MVDMVFTDPPYNIDYDFSQNGMVQTGQRKARFGKIKNDKMSDESFDRFIADAFANILLKLKDGGSYYISAGRESTLTFNRILKELGFHIQSWLIWIKEHFNISRLDYHPKHEVITYGWKQGAAHNWFTDRSQVDVLPIDREKAGTAVHPTQKPIALLVYLIKNSSKKNQSVLDLFAGSGSTLIACEQTGRINYSIELDESYCQVIIERYINFKKNNGEDVFLIRDGEKINYSLIKNVE